MSSTDGKDGAPGTDGKDGAPGADGKDGVDGTNGTDGKDGTDGTDGTDGKDGVLTGPASGDLDGNYPAPTVKQVSGLGLYPDGAGAAALRDPGARLNVYRTRDADGVNYERGYVKWTGFMLDIGTEAGGTGSAKRGVSFSVGGVAKWTIDAAGGITPAADVGCDLGRITYRIRNIYGGGGLSLGTNSVSTDYTTSYFDYTVRVDATDGPKSVVLLANSNIPAGKFQVTKKGSSGKSVGTFLDVTTVLEPA